MFPGQYPVVLRILSREQRVSSFEAYSARRNVPCDRLGGACLRRAMHEEAVGSKDLALQYWDSLRVVVDAADPPLSWFERIAVVMTYQGLGEKDAAIREALRLELDVRGWMEGYEVLQPTRALLAEVYTDFGEWDAAIDVLEDLVLPPSQLTVHILAIDPIWDPLRDHPRFQALLERYADDVEH